MSKKKPKIIDYRGRTGDLLKLRRQAIEATIASNELWLALRPGSVTIQLQKQREL